MSSCSVTVRIGNESFVAHFAAQSAPHSCISLRALLPYAGHLIHARWSGEALRAPLESAWNRTSWLPEENATECPRR
jgi:hypothetical protein